MVFGNDSFEVPAGLTTDEFLIRPLRATDVETDYAAVMESKAFLRKWDQSTWPRDDFTLAENLEDLERHQREHNERIAYTYTVMDLTATETLGCIYIFPRTMRWLTNVKSTPIGAKDWPDYEAVILFWIRQSRLAEEMDHRLLNVLRSWMAEAWTFDGLLFMTTEPFEQQVALFEEAGLQKQVELEHPKIAGKFLGYT